MKELKDFPGYFVSGDGRVFSCKKRSCGSWEIDYTIELKEMKPRVDSNGYLSLLITNKDRVRVTKRVHRIVAETYLPNPDNLPEVNHKDRDKTNNHVSNLEWCTHQQNIEHACAKTYTFKNRMTGEIIEAFNIKKWCKERDLDYRTLRRVIKGIRNHHKDWVLIA